MLLRVMTPVVFAAMLTAAHGQEATSASGGSLGPPACYRAFTGVTAGLPYTATRVETTVQHLADGSSVTTRYESTVARDAQGRTYSKGRFVPHGLQKEGSPEVFLFMITDPTTETISSWTTGQNDATVRVDHAPGMTEEVYGAGGPTQIHTLDGKMINGVYALGYRLTNTTPAGEQGNDRPLTRVSEWWCSPELKMTVASANTDLLAGDRTIELSHVDRGQPDPALFHLPVGYQIRENSPVE